MPDDDEDRERYRDHYRQSSSVGRELSLADAQSLRDQLAPDSRHRRRDMSMSSIEAAKRLGKLQARLAVIGREDPRD